VALRDLALTSLLVVALLGLPGGFARAEIYQWTDEKGRVHFGDRKLESVQQVPLDVKTAHSQWQPFAIAIETVNVELSEAERARISTDVNNVYRFFDNVLFFDMYKTVPVKIRIYPDVNAYQAYLAQVVDGSLPPSRGVYLPRSNEIVVYIQRNRAATFDTIKHETSHAIVDTITPFTTAWLNEGLAEQMETLQLENDRLVIGRNSENRYFVRQLGAEPQGLIGLEKMFALPSGEWRGHHSSTGVPLYCQTGELVYFLLDSTPGRNFIVRLLHRYQRGTRELSVRLVEQDYTGGVQAMQGAWNHWLGQNGSERIVLND
jgi:hypothetical protein